MVLPSEVRAVSGVLPLYSCPWKSCEFAPAALPELFLAVLSQLCLSHLAGQDKSVPCGIRSWSVPLVHTSVKQEVPRSCSPGIIQTSLGFIPLPSSCCDCLHSLEFPDQPAGTSSRFCLFLHPFCLSHPPTWLFDCILMTEPLGFVFYRRGG